MSKKFVRRNEIENLINAVKIKTVFGLSYKRVAPKCVDCGSSSKSWVGNDICPKCGGTLQYVNNTEVLAVSDNCFKGHLFEHFDNNRKAFRNCLINNIISIKIEENDFFVINI